MSNNARYTMDFELIPRQVKNDGIEFLLDLLRYREEYMCSIFNGYYSKLFNKLFFRNKPRKFTPDQFSITEHTSEKGFRYVYVSLPHEHEGSLVYCTAYVFVYMMEEDTVTFFTMFTVEKSVRNTTCIAHMWDGERRNIGKATGTAEGDIAYIDSMLDIEERPA